MKNEIKQNEQIEKMAKTVEGRMNKNEIKKALECCSKITFDACKECPYANNGETNCVEQLAQDALDLITEQENEIERLKEGKKQAQIDVLNRLKTKKYYV